MGQSLVDEILRCDSQKGFHTTKSREKLYKN